ncbi:MAG TPA: DJ-1/PfpI family protein [Rhodanobacteraceae bacterium]|nr:DJ-1/PfpI family protein [Rhodanobacteraceae bacterium]
MRSVSAKLRRVTEMTGTGPRTKSLKLIVFAAEPVEELDVAGPMAVFGHANRILCGKRPAYDMRVVGPARRRRLRGECGLGLLIEPDWRAAVKNTDTLLIAGGSGAMRLRDRAVLARLREVATTARRVGAICTGAFVLAEMGLLHARQATTHWMEASALAARDASIKLNPDAIWVRDGNVYTSAGVTAGMDLALALLEEDHGAAVALEVARRLVIFVRRPGGQAQFSTFLSAGAAETPALQALQAWLPQQIARKLDVAELAQRCCMSTRTFARAFVRETGITPARYVERLRVDAARGLMESSGRNLKAVARACGFRNTQGMRRAFLRTLAITPQEYHQRFLIHAG